MALEIGRLLGGVVRELTTEERHGAPARVLVATRTYDAPRAALWDALTNPERIPRWFLPITGDLRPGGRYQLEGNAGGEILACEAPTRLALTWEMHGQASWLTVTLADAPDGGTTLRLEHAAHVPEDFWQQYGPGAVGVGWDQALFGLEQHLAPGGPAVDPSTAMAWLASDEGRAFVHGSSAAWGEASIAAGTEPEPARAAAARTAAFYTGA
jgi:uncharacterized protein YndB with AHSA1/START domain